VIPAIARLSHSVRWNVEYPDYNAAGSFFAMALFVAVALIAASVAGRRRWWTVSAIVIATALWLTGSRAAYVAAVLAVAVAYLARWTTGHARKRWVTGIALVAATIAVIAVIAFAAPRRGNQGSSLAAADIRRQMAMVGARMIATHPVYGIGLGEFHQRSGEFGTWDLYFKFPVSLNENAHNNFIQVAAELGLLGGIPFAWLVVAGLFVTARAARGKSDAGDFSELLIFCGLSAFVITWLAGHPLLIPEPAYVFWIALGAAAGNAESGRTPAASAWPRSLTALAAAAIILAAPLHARAVIDDAELEHLGFGWSEHWMLSPDGIRYRAASGRGVVFVPSDSPITFSVNPRADRPVRLEVRLSNRVADVITLAPDRWTDVTLPKRPDQKARFIPMDLRVLDRDQTEIWLTKVRPIEGRR
jgi:O-Antigen ligase